MTEQPQRQLTEPNTGRIVDCWLGGSHHYPCDAEAAEQLLRIFPRFPDVFLSLRSFFVRAARYIHDQGVEQFIVFGAGIPTEDSVHEVLPDARVLYTDIDRENVRLGQEILRDTPRAGYAYCDASNFATFDRADAERVLGPASRLGLIMPGVSAFVADEPLRGFLRAVHEYAPTGSFLAFDFDSRESMNHPGLMDFLLSTGLEMRTTEQFAPLLGPWTLTDDGITPVSNWRIPESEASVPPFFYGGVATH